MNLNKKNLFHLNLPFIIVISSCLGTIRVVTNMLSALTFFVYFFFLSIFSVLNVFCVFGSKFISCVRHSCFQLNRIFTCVRFASFFLFSISEISRINFLDNLHNFDIIYFSSSALAISACSFSMRSLSAAAFSSASLCFKN